MRKLLIAGLALGIGGGIAPAIAQEGPNCLASTTVGSVCDCLTSTGTFDLAPPEVANVCYELQGVRSRGAPDLGTPAYASDGSNGQQAQNGGPTRGNQPNS